jgi:hypothetical protein
VTVVRLDCVWFDRDDERGAYAALSFGAAVSCRESALGVSCLSFVYVFYTHTHTHIYIYIHIYIHIHICIIYVSRTHIHSHMYMYV